MSRLLPALILSLGLIPSLLSAQGIEQAVLAQLNTQGFTEITVSRTLLGRLRILAYGNGYRREIVLNPVTGEILRDYLVQIDEDGTEHPSAPNLLSPSGSGSGSGSGSDDHSGSGSGGSDDHGGDDDNQGSDDHEDESGDDNGDDNGEDD